VGLVASQKVAEKDEVLRIHKIPFARLVLLATQTFEAPWPAPSLPIPEPTCKQVCHAAHLMGDGLQTGKTSHVAFR